MHQRKLALAPAVLKELLGHHQDGFTVVRDEHCDARHVRCAEGPRHRQTQSSGECDDPPLYVRVLRPIRVRDAHLPRRHLERVLLPENVRHLHPPRPVCLLRRGSAGHIPVPQWLGQLVPVHMAPRSTCVKGEVAHELIVDFVFVAHVLDDAVPQGRKGGREWCRYRSVLVPVLGVLRGQHLLREACGDLRHGVLQSERQALAPALHEHGPQSHEGARDGEPKLGVGEEEEERGAPKENPQQDVGPPGRAV
mmetsp:Transcript_109177/g.282165  ORF Transcript_109177/g.282165 Transcript_109177/m.282165 type:complete len:251 (+) Transcript_109177:1815-2567(+)